eukprot:m.143010 g.143010  ORF g.143010 m.143010 type:complete len:1047 (+) comp52633_c2_seq1:470-3610(+)
MERQLMERKFTGFQDDIKTYLAVFKVRASEEEKTRKVQLIQCLSDDVIAQLQAIEDLSKSKSEQIEALLMKQYQRGDASKFEALQKLKTVQQKEGQSARAFAGEIATLAQQADVSEPRQLIEHFLAGVQIDLVKSYGATRRDSLADTAEDIQLIQDRLANVELRRGATATSAAAANIAPVRQVQWHKGQKSRGRSKSPSQRRSPSPGPLTPAEDKKDGVRFQGECYRCHKYGHRAAECRGKIATVVGAVKTALSLNVGLGERNLSFVIDTGSSYTLMKLSKAQELGLHLKPCKSTAVGADSRRIKFEGQVICDLEVDGVTEPIKILAVKSLAFDFLAGLDFLQRFKLVLDPANRKVQFASGKSLDLDSGEICSVAQSTTEKAEPPSQESVQLSDAQEFKLKSILAQFPDLFSSEANQMRLANVPAMSIELVEGAKPVRVPPRRYSFEDIRDQRMIIQAWARQGVIRRSRSSWSSPPLVVRQQKKPRLAIDYTRLNELSEVKPYQLPLVDDIRRLVQGAQVFSKLDLKSGFLLVPLVEKASQFAAFTDCDGKHWEPTRTAFGLKGSPTHFQEVMDTVLSGVDGCFCYIDDVLLYTRTVDEHLQVLENVLRRLEEAKLLINSDKLLLMRNSVQFLGNIISAQGIRPDPEKVEAIQKLPAPRDRAELRRFFGMAGWLRMFVKDFGKAKAPLQELLKKSVPFVWKQKHNAAFEELKAMISKACLLYNPDMKKELILETDASLVGLGAVLLQQGEDGTEYPVQFLSRALTDTETRWWGTTKLSSELITSRCSGSSHLKGGLNVKADFLSRHHPPQDAEVKEEWVVDEVVAAASATSPAWTNSKELGRLQQQDDFCNSIQKARGPARQALAHGCKVASFHYSNEDVLLADVPHKRVPKTVIVVPKALVPSVLEAMHNWPQGGHLGQTKTLARTRAQFYWPALPAGELIGHFPNDLVAMDFMGPVAVATKDQRAETVAQVLLDHWIGVFGAPKRLLSDNGKCFTAPARRWCRRADERNAARHAGQGHQRIEERLGSPPVSHVSCAQHIVGGCD